MRHQVLLRSAITIIVMLVLSSSIQSHSAAQTRSTTPKLTSSAKHSAEPTAEPASPKPTAEPASPKPTAEPASPEMTGSLEQTFEPLSPPPQTPPAPPEAEPGNTPVPSEAEVDALPSAGGIDNATLVGTVTGLGLLIAGLLTRRSSR